MKVAIADAELAARVTAAVTEAVARRAAELVPAVPLREVRLRSRARLAARQGELAGALAIVGVTPRNARWLRVLVDGARLAGCAGVQLVWDGSGEGIERYVFEVLEHARATPDQAPVVLAAAPEPVPALVTMVAFRAERAQHGEQR